MPKRGPRTITRHVQGQSTLLLRTKRADARAFWRAITNKDKGVTQAAPSLFQPATSTTTLPAALPLSIS